jgi:predicted nucleotidyltransferase
MVRILRVLSRQEVGMTASVIAKRAALGRSGAGRALERLVSAGVVEVLGAGQRPQYHLAEQHQLALAIRQLFEREASRIDGFLELVRAACRRMRPVPKAVWLLGSVARGQDEPPSDVDLAIVQTKANLESLQRLNGVVRKAADELGLTVSLVAFTPQDLERHARSRSDWWQNLLTDAIPVLGPAPRSLLGG